MSNTPYEELKRLAEFGNEQGIDSTFHNDEILKLLSDLETLKRDNFRLSAAVYADIQDTDDGNEYAYVFALKDQCRRYREALEYIQLENKSTDADVSGPSDMRYWREQEFKSRIAAQDALKLGEGGEG